MENTLQNSMQSSNLEDYMIQKKIEIMMDMNNKKINNELSKMSSMIAKLNEEIVAIKKNFNGNDAMQRKPVEVFETRKEIDQDALSIPRNNFNTPKNEADKPKPRYGDYKPEDVNIDKFFYFGNKK